ncbi:MAG: hypothetical protein WKF58_18890 [Ilumatobacteraceae bacterium]
MAMVMVRVSYTEGDDHRYAVPVQRVSGEHGAELEQLHPGAADRPSRRRVDGRRDGVGGGAADVVKASLARRTYRGRSSTVRGHPRRTGIHSLADDARDVHVLGVEQSNSSAIVGAKVIAKLVRQVVAGENPDVTLPLHLRARGFEHSPGVAATLDITLADEAAPANLVVVHDAVPNESDLWQWSQDLLSREVERLVSEPDRGVRRRRHDRRDRDARHAHRRDAPRLASGDGGLRARAVHVAAAAGDSAEPAGVAARDAAAAAAGPPRADARGAGDGHTRARRRRFGCSPRSRTCGRASSMPHASASTATSTSGRCCGRGATSSSSTSRASPDVPSASVRSSARR